MATEHIPVLDMVKVVRYLEDKETRLIGPNCPVLLLPVKLNWNHAWLYPQKGHVGVVSRSVMLSAKQFIS